MSATLFVTASVLLHTGVVGDLEWIHIASLHHSMSFADMEDCELYKASEGADLTEYVESTALSWWIQQPHIRREDLRLQTLIECLEDDS